MIPVKEFKAYIQLMKPSILIMVVVTAALGYYFGCGGIVNFYVLFYLMLGSGLSCGGAAALNHYLERDVDALMERTKNRPIPSGTISAPDAFLFGIFLILFGIWILCWKVNLLTAFLSLLTSFLYALVYTPLKKVSWINTTIGAIPGALPPVGGWAAATGDLGSAAWALFLILFLWQHPHFYAIAWLCKDDYKKGGFKMLSVIDPSGRRLFEQTLALTLLMIPAVVLPNILEISGPLYLFISLSATVWLCVVAVNFVRQQSRQSAVDLLKATVFYLPILLLAIITDFTFL